MSIVTYLFSNTLTQGSVYTVRRFSGKVLLLSKVICTEVLGFVLSIKKGLTNVYRLRVF